LVSPEDRIDSDARGRGDIYARRPAGAADAAPDSDAAAGEFRDRGANGDDLAEAAPLPSGIIKPIRSFPTNPATLGRLGTLEVRLAQEKRNRFSEKIMLPR
jgi:hypothetical protein